MHGCGRVRECSQDRGDAGHFDRSRRLLVGLALLASCDALTDPRATPRLVSDTPSLDFGSTTLGIPVSRIATLAVRDLGAVDVTGAQLDTVDPSFFLPQVPSRLSPGDASKVTMVFRPTEAGEHRGLLRIGVRGGPDVLIALAGRGVDARARPVDALDFGSPARGEVRRRILTLRNDAETPVPVALRVTGADAAQFSPADTVLTVAAFADAQVEYLYSPCGRTGPRDVSIQLVSCPLCTPARNAIGVSASVSPLLSTVAGEAAPAAPMGGMAGSVPGVPQTFIGQVTVSVGSIAIARSRVTFDTPHPTGNLVQERDWPWAAP